MSTFKREPWMADAACREISPDVFFTEQGESQAPAMAYCASCVVRQNCLDYALAEGIIDGVWGGLSARARMAITRRRGRRGPVIAEHGTRRTMRTCDCAECVARLEFDRENQRRYKAEWDARRRRTVGEWRAKDDARRHLKVVAS